MEYNWVFHIFKVWGKGTVVTHRWAAFFFQRNPEHERVLQDLGCTVSFPAIWFLQPSRLSVIIKVCDR